ncbi:MAG: DUF6498-containing protein [Pseudomonadota bacterium]
MDSGPWAIAALIVTNLIPLFGVLLLEWDLLSVLLIYWLETLLVCGLTLLRLLLCGGIRALGSMVLFLMAFVSLSAAHMAVIATLADALNPSELVPDLSAAANVTLFEALGVLYGGGLAWIGAERPVLLTLVLPALFIGQLVAYWRGPVRRLDQRQSTAQSIMGRALGRVVISHVALLLGSAVIVALGFMDLLPVLALLILFKLLFELRMHRQAEHEAQPGEQ